MLTIPIYIGKIKHKDKLYDGEHQPIIAPNVFFQVGENVKPAWFLPGHNLPKRPRGTVAIVSRVCFGCPDAVAAFFSPTICVDWGDVE